MSEVASFDADENVDQDVIHRQQQPEAQGGGVSAPPAGRAENGLIDAVSLPMRQFFQQPGVDL